MHRDIKPSNLFWNKENKKLILIDFGISKKLIQNPWAITPTGT